MRNIHVLLIIQALLLMLLFFSEGYVQYATIGLFALIDLILLADLFTKKWSFEELLTFAAVFTSALFLVFYTMMRSNNTLVLGAEITILFLVISILYVSTTRSKTELRQLRKPEVPEFKYHVEYEPYHEEIRTPEPVMHIKREKPHKVSDKLAAKAVAYELEREANQMKNAQHIVDKVEVYNAEKELETEAREMMEVQKQINAIKSIQKKVKSAKKKPVKKVVKKVESKPKTEKVVKTVKTVKTVTITPKAPKAPKVETVETKPKKRRAKRKKGRRTTHRSSKGMKLYAVRDRFGRFKDIQRYSRAHAMDIKRKSRAEIEAKAEKEAKLKAEGKKSSVSKKKVDNKKKDQIKFLEKQEKIINEAKKLAQAQQAISAINASAKAPEESFYFATENGNKFHEPGCMSIKDVPKNKLTLYTTKKDAMKKGLQPCGTCIPK